MVARRPLAADAPALSARSRRSLPARRRPAAATVALLSLASPAPAAAGQPTAAASPRAVASTPARARPTAQTPQGTQSTDDEQRARARFVAALRLAEQGRFEEALAAALEGERLDPDNADGLNLLGQIYEKLERPAEAEQAYLRAIRADPAWHPPLQNLGTFYLRREQYAAALAPLERAVELQPDQPLLHALLAVALQNTDHLREAEQHYTRAMELDPDNPAAAIDVATARIALGELKGAIAAAERAVQLDPDNRLGLAVLAGLLARTGDPDQLVRVPALYRRLIELQPERPELWEALAQAYNELALREEAEAALRRAIELGKDDARVYFNLGQTLSRQQRFAAAREAYDQAISRDPRLGIAYYFRGEASFNLDRPEEALADFRRAIEIMPDDPDPMLAAVQILLVQGDLEAADELLQRALATGRRRSTVLLTLGRLRVRQGRHEEALQALGEIPPDAKQYVEALYLSGQSLLKLGRVEEGRAALARYQELFNEQRKQEVDALRVGLVGRARIYLMRTRVYLNEGRLDLALEQAEAAVELAPDNPQAWHVLADVQEARGDAEAARRARERAQRLEEHEQEGRADPDRSHRGGRLASGSPGHA